MREGNEIIMREDGIKYRCDNDGKCEVIKDMVIIEVSENVKRVLVVDVNGNINCSDVNVNVNVNVNGMFLNERVLQLWDNRDNDNEEFVKMIMEKNMYNKTKGMIVIATDKRVYFMEYVIMEKMNITVKMVKDYNSLEKRVIDLRLVKYCKEQFGGFIHSVSSRGGRCHTFSENFVIVYDILNEKEKYEIRFIEYVYPLLLPDGSTYGSGSYNSNNEIVWTIYTTSGSTFFGVDTLQHYVNHRYSETESLLISHDSIPNGILLVYDDFEVHVLYFSTMTRNYVFNFTKKFNTRIYKGNNIQVAKFIPDQLRVLDFDASDCEEYVETRSQPIFLFVSEKIETGSKLSFVSIPEFQNLYITGDFVFLFIDNYFSHRLDQCGNFSQWYDGLKCRKRKVIVKYITENVKSTEVRFMNSFSSDYSTPDWKLSMKSLCGFVMDFSSKELKDLNIECANFNGSEYKCDLEMLKNNVEIRKLLFTRFWYHLIFIETEEGLFRVYSMGYELNQNDQHWFTSFNGSTNINTLDFYVRETTFIQSPGGIINYHISKNGFYFTFIVSREMWEIESFERISELCKIIKQEEYTKYFMGNYFTINQMCQERDYNLQIDDFLFFSTICTSNVYCPSLEKSIMKPIENGFYASKPFLKKPCPSGYVCFQGNIRKVPRGTFSYSQSIFPTLCTPDQTKRSSCSNEGSVYDFLPCIPGSICNNKYSRIGVPPGYKQTYTGILPNSYFEECYLSEYCPGMTIQDPLKNNTLCPEGHYCEHPKILIPTECKFNVSTDLRDTGYSDYCPIGTTFKRKCPAGFFCNGPIHIERCETPYYCPEGSFKPIPCPAGFYCENPSKSEVCPFNHFCPEASVLPKRCGLLNILCVKGSSVNSFNFFNIGGIFLVFLAIVIFYMIFFKMIKKRKKKAKSIKGEKVGCFKLELVVDLGVSDLFMKLKKNNKTVVNGMNCLIGHGNLTGIMGSSGCGKTSFLNALAGRSHYGDVEGRIYVNGIEWNLQKLKEILCYVPQNDIMTREMTVRETLFFSSRIRLSNDITNNEINEKVDKVLTLLNLNRISESIIGDENNRGISGGELKRVNIGMELTTNPVILIIDEPTTGLDSSSSISVMKCLKEIAHQGINVIIVIHQPRYEIFSQMDNIILLSEGGNLAYIGTPSEAKEYFVTLGYVKPLNVNPSDYYLDVINGNAKNENGKVQTKKYFVEHWKNHYEHKIKDEIKNIILNEEKTKDVVKEAIRKELMKRKISFRLQIKECLKRCLIMKLRDVKGFCIDNALSVCSAVIIGVLYSGFTSDLRELYQQTICISLLLTFSGMASSLSSFGERKSVFVREIQSGLIPFSHYISVNLIDLADILLIPLIFTLSVFYLATPMGRIFFYYVISVGIYWSSYSMGYCISLVFENKSKIVCVLVSAVLNFVGGLVVNYGDMKNEWVFPFSILPFLSFVSYSNESYFIVEIEAFKSYYDVEEILNSRGYKRTDIYYSIFLIYLHGIIVRIICYFILVSVPPDSKFNYYTSIINKYFSGKFIILKDKLYSCCKNIINRLKTSSSSMKRVQSEANDIEEIKVIEIEKEDDPKNYVMTNTELIENDDDNALLPVEMD